MQKNYLIITVVTLLLAGFLVTPGGALAANSCTWSAVSPGNGSTPGNWTACGGAYPGASDSAIINSGNVTLDVSASVTNLALSHGTLTGAQNIAISGAFTWSGGSRTGSGATDLAATGTLAASGSTTLILDTRTFNNAGTVNWNSSGYEWHTSFDPERWVFATTWGSSHVNNLYYAHRYLQ